MPKLAELLRRKKILVADGAWGTILQSKDDTVDIPEELNFKLPDFVSGVALNYLEAGADIVSTNTFGANRWKLDTSSSPNSIELFNEQGAKNSKAAVASFKSDALVMGSIGPSGKFLLAEEVTKEELEDSYRKQALGLIAGGADILLLETCYDLEESRIAINSIREVSDIEIGLSFTFNIIGFDDIKTFAGVSIEEFALFAKEMNVDFAGSNCGTGFNDMLVIAHHLKALMPVMPLLVKGNAGLPIVRKGKLEYPETPYSAKSYATELIRIGINIIGGCCGTTPEHIKVIRRSVDAFLSGINGIR